MAVVGDAYVIVRAITRGVPNDIRQGFSGADRIGQDAGSRVGRSFQQGFRRSGGGGGLFGRQFQIDARNTFRSLSRLITIGYVLGPALAGTVAAISALGSGLVALSAQALAAGPALLSLLGVFSALIQGAIALKLAFIGVGAAISAGLKSGGGGGGGGSAEAAEAAAKRVEDARRRLAEAIENAAEVEERAARQVEDAWRDYQESIEETTDAVDRLKNAQREAAEMTQQLGFDVEEAALAQERAGMRLEQARQQLAAVSDLPVDSAARREAELAFREAELEYRRSIDRNNDLRQEQEEAAEAGSAGADLLVDASKDVADAKQREADAFRDYQDAVVDAERARRDAQRAIIEAEEELADALKDLEKGFGGAGGGADAFAEAMAKLSPEAQAFVRYIISIQDELKKLRFAAGRKLFPQLIIAIDNLVKNLFPRLIPLLEGTGDAIGKVAIQISKTITAADNLGNLERIWKTNDKVIRSLGGTISNLLSILLDLLDAARPLTEEFAEWTKTLTGGWKTSLQVNKETGALADTMSYAGEIARQLGRIFGNLFDAFMNIGKAASGPGSGGEMILNAFEDATKKFEEFTRVINENGELEDFFRDVATNFIAIGRGVTRFVKGFIDLGNNQGVANFFNTISQDGGAIDSFFSAFEKMADSGIGQVMAELANNLMRIFDALTDTAAFQIFFDILNNVAKALADFISNEKVARFLAIAAAVFAVTRAFRVLWWTATIVFKFIAGAFITFAAGAKTAAGALGGLITLLKGGGLAGASTAAAGGFTGLAGALGIGLGPLAAIIAAIAAVIGILVGAYAQSEIFRESLSEMAKVIGGALSEAWEILNTAFSEAFEWIGGGQGIIETLLDALKTLGDILGTYVVPIIRDVLVVYIKILANWWGFLIRVVGGVIQSIVSYFSGFASGIRPYIEEFITLWTENVQPVIDSVVEWFQSDVGPKFEEVFEKVQTAVTTFWQFVQPIFEAFGRVVGTVIGFWLVNSFKSVITIVGAVAGVISWLWNNIARPIFNAWVWYLQNIWVPAVSLIWQTFQNVLDLLSPIFDLIAGLFRVWFGVVRSVVGAIVQILSLPVRGFQAMWRGISSIWNSEGSPRINEIRSTISSILQAIGKLWDEWIVQPFNTAWRNIRIAWVTVIQPFLSGLASTITGIGSTLWNGLSTGISGVVSAIKGQLNNLIGVINEAIRRFNSIPLNPIQIDPIPYLAMGGVVRPRAGGTLVRVAEAGQAERVEPLDPNGLSTRDKAMIDYMSAKNGVVAGGGSMVTVNVYPSEGMDERQLASRVSRVIAQQMRKGAA